MDRDLVDVEFTVFDTETTGLDPKSGDRIVELAAIRVKGKEIIATFQSLVNPHRMIQEAAYQVNHISPEMLKCAPEIDTVIADFLKFIKGSCLCSYNAGFDLGFINNELELLNKPLLKNIFVVDVLKMAKILLPGLDRYALWFVAEKLGIKTEQVHRALQDTELTLDIFHKLKGILKEKDICDFRSFSSLFGISTNLLDDINNQKLAKIQEAIDLGLSLRMKYLASSNAEVTVREVMPKEIKQEKNRFYLVGYCCLRKEERTFNVNGILHFEIL